MLAPDTKNKTVQHVSRLCLLIYGLSYFDVNCVFTPISTRSYHSSHHLTLLHPFSHTNSYMHSFVSATIGLWNHLDEDTVLSPSLASFKYELYHFFVSIFILFGDHDHVLAFLLYSCIPCCVFSATYS